MKEEQLRKLSSEELQRYIRQQTLLLENALKVSRERVYKKAPIGGKATLQEDSGA